MFTQSMWTRSESSYCLVGGTLGEAAVDPTFILQVEPATAPRHFIHNDGTAE